MKFLDILNNIEFKGDKANILLKWVIGIAISAIFFAFIIGQLKTEHFNKLDNIETLAIEGIEKSKELEKKMIEGLSEQNVKIDRIYDDGIEAFNEYREFNNEQMKLIVDYSEDNKELLKKMLDINSKEKAIEIKNDILHSRSEDKINSDPTTVLEFINEDTQICYYYVLNAPENYLDSLDLTKFEIIEKVKSETHDNLYNFKYVKK